MVFAVTGIDRQIVDAGDASPHQTLLVKFPVLVAVAAEPVAAVVVPFVSKPHSDAIVPERPDLLDKTIVQLALPFSRQGEFRHPC